MILGDVVDCAKTFVFFFLETDSETEAVHELAKRSINDWSYDGLCAATAASSANSMSLIIVFLLLFFLSDERGWTVFRHFVYACIYLLPLCQKPVWGATKRKLIPLRVLKCLDTFPSCCTVPHILLWNDSMRLFSFSGHPILVRILNKPSLLTRSKAFVRSMNELCNGILFSLHFSCIWRTEKIISTVDRPKRTPHCDSGYTRMASCCSRTSITRAKILPTTFRGKYLYSYCSQFVLICSYTEWLFWDHACHVGLHAIIDREFHAMVVAGRTCMSWSDGILSDPGALPLVKWSMAMLNSSMDGTWFVPWFKGTLKIQVHFETQCSDESRYLSNVPPIFPFARYYLWVDEFIEEVILWNGPTAFLMPS